MRLTLFLMILSVFSAYSSSYAQKTKLNLNVQNIQVKEVLNEIENQTEFFFMYDNKQVDVERRVNIEVNSQTIDQVLQKLFEGTSTNYTVVNRQILLFTEIQGTTFQQQSIKVSGKVTDASGASLPGVSILVKGTTQGTITDSNGNYSLSNVPANATLQFSFVGMQTLEVAVGGKTTVNATLEEMTIGIEEVVAVGYGTQKKVNLTGAIDVVQQDALKNRPSSNVGALLQGQAPNLNISVTGAGGEPGAGNAFNIRGIGSLSGSGSPLILVDGVEMNINNLDPDAIESVSVLKDAASAAIYGSRAPFGVVLITTKKGSKDKGVSISYSNNISIASPIGLPSWQSSLRYVTAYNQSLENSGQAHKFSDAQIDRIKRHIAGTYTPEYDTINPPQSIWAGRHQGNANYDWWDIYWKDHRVNQKHNINISGGDEKTQYYINTGIYDQGGSYNFAKEYYRRYNVLANITSQATSWLRFNLNTKYSKTKSSHPNLGSDWDPGRTMVISEMTKFFSTTPWYNVNGTENNPYVNVLRQAGPAIGNENDLFVAMGSELEPIKGWKTNINYSYNFSATKNTWLDAKIISEIPNGQVLDDWWVSPDYYTENWHFNHYESFNATTAYEKTIKSHFFKAMAGYERESKYFSRINGMRYDLITEEVPSFATATGTSNLSDAKSHWATEAVFGRINYNYKEKYLLEANGRYDGSSRFAKDSRWGFFPSFSAGYNISKEPFWDSLQHRINNLKLRGSYGSLGNQNVPNYLYLSNVPININLGWILDGVRPNYAELPAIISPTLTWETINTLDFGLDANFLNNRLGLVFDWYQRNTLNMFGPTMIVPTSLGTDPPQENNASLSTKGWEITLDWKDKINSDLSYSAKLTLADSRSHVTKYLNTTGQIDEYYVGREIGEIWGYETVGLLQTAEDVASMPDQSYFHTRWGPGDVEYKDLNGDKIINDGNRTLASHGDLSIIGNWSPRFNIGFTGTVTWKNFDFSMFWQGVLRRDLPSQSYYGSNVWWGIGTRGDGGGAFYQGMDDYWRPANETNILGPNTDAYYPKPYVSSETYKNQQTQTRYMLNGAYIRLKNIQLGYNIPKNLTSKIKVQAIKIYASGENLMTIDKMPAYLDPETSFAADALGVIYPLSSSISFGLNVTF